MPPVINKPNYKEPKAGSKTRAITCHLGFNRSLLSTETYVASWLKLAKIRSRFLVAVGGEDPEVDVVVGLMLISPEMESKMGSEM